MLVYNINTFLAILLLKNTCEMIFVVIEYTIVAARHDYVEEDDI